MTLLPITHMTLYKHGVGFFERRVSLAGTEVSLTFRVEEMNDILKSLTAIDWGGGQVLGVEYATPQTREERLAGCSINLSDDRSLQDLLTGLRGRRVRLLLDQAESLAGSLIGLDDAPEEEPLATALVSLLLDGANQVQAMPLGRVQGVEILDERGAADLRFFLQTSLTQEAYRAVTVRLTPGEHDLSVSYIAPAPTWRVSYRLVVEDKDEQSAESETIATKKALLLGWGIFDNRLEEDLKEISLSLVAGMPISFVYDLYTPFTPKRPEITNHPPRLPRPHRTRSRHHDGTRDHHNHSTHQQRRPAHQLLPSPTRCRTPAPSASVPPLTPATRNYRPVSRCQHPGKPTIESRSR